MIETAACIVNPYRDTIGVLCADHDGEEVSLTVAEVRALAAELLAAADQIDPPDTDWHGNELDLYVASGGVVSMRRHGQFIALATVAPGAGGVVSMTAVEAGNVVTSLRAAAELARRTDPPAALSPVEPAPTPTPAPGGQRDAGDGTAGVAYQAGYDRAVSTLLGVADRTGSPAARWAADYLTADPDRRASAPTDTTERPEDATGGGDDR